MYIRIFCLFIFIALITATAIDAFTSSNGAPSGYTNAPGESNCTSCHSGSVITSGTNWNNIILTSNIPATGYIPDSTYNITLSHTQSGIVKFGFSITALNSSNNKAGVLIVTNSTTMTLTNGTRDYIGQLSSGTSGSGSISWSFQWKAPSTPSGNITFYTCVNATNNSNSFNGDQIYAKTFSFSQSSLLPVASINPTSITVCSGDTASFQGSGTNNTTIYNWTASGATPTTSTQQNPKFVYANPGTYTVNLTVKNNKGTSLPVSATVTVTTKPVNTLSITGPAKPCAGDSVLLSSNAGGNNITYAWSHGPSTKSVYIKNTGSYRVTVTNTANGCINRSTFQNFTFNALPTVNLISSDPNDSICIGDSVLFTASPAGLTSYQFRNALVQLQNTGSHTYQTNTFSGTNNKIHVIATDSNGCKSVPNDTIRLNVLLPLSEPIISCGTTTTSSIDFVWTAVSGALGYEVSLDSGKTWQNPSSGNTGLNHLITGLPASKQVSIKVRAIGVSPCFKGGIGDFQCSTNSCSGITYNLLSDSAVCTGDSATIVISNISKPQYGLSFENGVFGKNNSFTFLPTATKTYQITMIDSTALNCTPIQIGVPVKVNSLPAVTVSAQPLFRCLGIGESVNFQVSANSTNTISLYTFVRNNQDTLQSSSSSVFNTTIKGIVQDSLYDGDSVYVKVKDLNGCESTSSSKVLNIKINPKPVVKFAEQIYIYALGMPINFRDSTTNANSWLWKFGDGATSTLQNPIHTYVTLGTYLVKKIVTSPAGCIDSAEAIVIISNEGISTGKELYTKVINIYPNPASGMVFINFQPQSGIESLALYDLTGRLIRTQPVLRETELIDVSQLSEGMYLVRASGNTGVYEKRLAIVHNR